MDKYERIYKLHNILAGRRVPVEIGELLQALDCLYSDNLDEKGATIWMRSLVSRQTHHDGRFARPQACCLAICRAATPLRWF